MTPEQETLSGIRAQIDALPEEERFLVQAMAQSIRNITHRKFGQLALALVGAEMAAQS